MMNDLIVLFNNAEEIGLLGARDFALNDPDYDSIKGFINLDCFPGTKSILFRSTGSWLDKLYRVVPRPLANVFVRPSFHLPLRRFQANIINILFYIPNY